MTSPTTVTGAAPAPTRPIELVPPPFLPASIRCFKFGECHVIVGHEPAGWHLSISHETRYPTWDEIRDARYALCPDDITMSMLLPPKGEYTNLHERCFHLWEVTP